MTEQENTLTAQALVKLCGYDSLEALKNVYSADAANALARLSPPNIALILKTLPLAMQAEIMSYFPCESAARVMEAYGEREFAAVMNHMPHDDRADILKCVDDDAQRIILQGMAQAEREDIKRLSSYPEKSVGAIMTSEYATLPLECTVGEALDILRKQAPNSETINRAYVIDAQRHYYGNVRLKDLIIHPVQTPVASIMAQKDLALYVDEPQEYAAQQISKYDIIAMPVLDRENRLVGLVTHDDAMDVMQQETTEDFHKVGSVRSLNISMREASSWLLYRKRISWLLILVFGNIFSGAGIAYFEDTIASYIALVFFLPLLIDSGGNAGSQSSTLMVRALATGDVVIKDWARMLGRELLVAVALGLTMAVAVSAIGVFRGGMDVAVVVAITMVLVVIAGSMIGMSLPFLLSRLKIDPATASAPLITSIADAVGVLIFFGVATALLMP